MKGDAFFSSGVQYFCLEHMKRIFVNIICLLYGHLAEVIFDPSGVVDQARLITSTH